MEPLKPMHTNGDHFNLEVRLPENRLEPNRMLQGVVMLRNVGQRPQARFSVALDGLPAYCQRIDPLPPLDPGGKCQINFRLYHYGNQPLAGEWMITFTATSPEAYPGEEARASCTIQVQPYYRHQVRFSADEALSARLASIVSPAAPPVEQAAPPDKANPTLPTWYLEFVQAQPDPSETPSQTEK